MTGRARRIEPEAERTPARRRGRPSKFSAEVAERLIYRAILGDRRAEMVRRVGIASRTLAYWLARGRAGVEPYGAWAGQFLDAEGRARRRRFWAGLAKQRAADRERWKRFKASREGWWRRQLGEREFWRQRAEWLAGRGHVEALRRAIDAYRRADD